MNLFDEIDEKEASPRAGTSRARPPRARREPAQKVVVAAPRPPTGDREKFMRWLYKEHGPFILLVLLGRRDIGPESAQDIRQEVLLAVDAYVTQKALPDNMRG